MSILPTLKTRHCVPMPSDEILRNNYLFVRHGNAPAVRPAWHALSAARDMIENDVRRFAPQVFASQSTDGIQWIEEPEKNGLRFVAYAKDTGATEDSGWYMDDVCDSVIRGVLYQLPARNRTMQFVVGYDDEANGKACEGGPARLDLSHIYQLDAVGYDSPINICDVPGIEKIGMEAHKKAEQEAESMREYSAAWNAGCEAGRLTSLILDMRREFYNNHAELAGLEARPKLFPSLIKATRAGLTEIWQEYRDRQACVTKLREGDLGDYCFYPSPELQVAFQEGFDSEC